MKLFLGKDLKEEEICWKCAHPQAIQDVDEFILESWIDLEKFSITYLLTDWSSSVNECHQNEISADKNITAIHKYPHHSSFSVCYEEMYH